MRGLTTIPSIDDLAGAYGRLQGRERPDASAILADEISLWSQWARFDPRLAEQLVEFLSQSWKKLDAFAIRESLLRQPWPQAFGVLLEHALDAGLEAGWIQKQERALFRGWEAIVLSGIAPAAWEQFFIGLRKIGGKQMLLDAQHATRSYLRWGYFGRDALVNKERAGLESGSGRTLIPRGARKAVLKELMASRSRLTVQDYRESLDYRVSRRQAELDLAAEPRLKAIGQTRARVYRVMGVRDRRGG